VQKHVATDVKSAGDDPKTENRKLKTAAPPLSAASKSHNSKTTHQLDWFELT